jgi:hypothetical protein
MSSKKAFYSVVQYCPDRFRAERVNVGLVLYREEPRFLRAKIIDNHRRVKRLFGISGKTLETLRLSEDNLLYCLNERGEEIATLDHLKAFIATRANDLRLTEPRLSVVSDIETDFARLFKQLVADEATAALALNSPAEVLPPKLGEVFYRLASAKKIWSPGRIIVPVYKRRLEIPYAYRNGAVNFVKPHVFPANKHAETQAASLAVNGDLINRHPVDGENCQLIVVSTYETSDQRKEITEHVEPLFQEYGVRLIRPESVDAFAKEVEQTTTEQPAIR